MAIRGSLREASLPDVLQLLALGQKTGCLAVTDGTRFGYVYFDRGNISYASIVNRRDRLGDLLVRNGLLSPEALAAAVDAQSSRTGKRLGEILIESGSITREQLERYIRVQIEEAVYYLFTWTQGTFSFTAGQRPDEGEILVSLHPETVLLEGARRVDEWSLIQKKIPTLDLLVGFAGDLSHLRAEELTREQRRVLPLLDGRRSVREVVEECGLGEFDTAKAVFGLMQAGFAVQLGRKTEAARGGSRTERAEDHRNLGVAFYRTGMLADALRELTRALELAPDDASTRFHLALAELRSGRPRRAMSRFRALIESGAARGAAFHNLALALESIGLADDALAALDEAARHLGDDPALSLSRGIALCKAGRPAEAAGAFADYRARLAAGDRAPAVYYAFAMIAAGATGRLPDARSLADEGVRHYPHVGPVLLHAGAVHERMAAWNEAEMLYRRAVEESPRSARARKALADALHRRHAHVEAAHEYLRAIELDPDRAEDALFRLGNLRYREGRREEAVALWRRALERNPANAAARTNLELVERALSAAAAQSGTNDDG